MESYFEVEVYRPANNYIESRLDAETKEVLRIELYKDIEFEAGVELGC